MIKSLNTLRIPIILIIIFSTFTSSCSLIINGTTDKMLINSTPQGAIIYIDGKEVGLTPKNLELERGDDYLIEIKLKGYQSFQIMAISKESPWVLGNLISWGLIGLLVDILSGASYDIKPDSLNITLDPIDSSDNRINVDEKINLISL